MSNLVSTKISDEDLQTVLQAINTIHQKLPFLIKLSHGHKKTTAMIDDGRYPFASKAVDYASRETSLCPNAMLLDEAQKNINVYDKLPIVLNQSTMHIMPLSLSH